MITRIKTFEKNYLTVLLAIPLLIVMGCAGGLESNKQKINSDGNTNDAPNIAVSSPEDGGSQDDNSLTNLSAAASDLEDGDLSETIQWSSDLDGELGVGADLAVFLSSGNHLISASVTDSENQTAVDTISYTTTTTTGVVNISWTAPTKNTDDSDLLNLEGFKVYYGEVENELSNSIILESSTIRSTVIGNLKSDQIYYFAVTAYNTDGMESIKSEVLSKYIDS